jgi:hypothetical protein
MPTSITAKRKKYLVGDISLLELKRRVGSPKLNFGKINKK